MNSILHSCKPRQDLISGSFNPEVFTASLRQVIGHYRGDIKVNTAYTDAKVFFEEATSPTHGMRRVIEHVLRDRQESGLMPASLIVEENEFPNEACRNNGNVLSRLQRLEEGVAELSAMLSRQIEDHERKAEDYEDKLVHKLEGMLVEERKRSDELMLKYGQIKDKLNK